MRPLRLAFDMFATNRFDRARRFVGDIASKPFELVPLSLGFTLSNNVNALPPVIIAKDWRSALSSKALMSNAARLTM